MEYAQKRLDYEQTDRLSNMTEEEKRKLVERKAQGLQRVIERADAVLAGNKKLLEKRESERRSVTTVDWKENLKERRRVLAGNKKLLEERVSERRSATRANQLEKLREREARADAVVAENEKFLEEMESERRSATTVDWKKELRERKALELREVMDRADVAFEVFRASATGSGQ